MMKLSCTEEGERARVGEIVLGDKFIRASPVHRDWRRWAISNKGGIALDKAIRKITGYYLLADWYGDCDEPYQRKHTFKPTDELVTFCGVIIGCTLSYDIDSQVGVVGLYAQTTPENEAKIKEEIVEFVKKIEAALAEE